MPVSVPGAHGDSLSLRFQPIVEPGGPPWTVRLVEALRLDPRVLGQFTAAQRRELDVLAIGAAAVVVKDWHCWLSANTSWQDLRFDDYAINLLAILAAADFPPRRFVMELLESSPPLIDYPGVQPNIVRLAAAGIRIIFDDAGTEYAKYPGLIVRTLRNQPRVNTEAGATDQPSFYGLKLARELIANIESESGFALAAYYLQAARDYYVRSRTRLTTTLFIAEGVETEQQLARVRELARYCKVRILVQGYLVSHKAKPRELLENPDLRLAIRRGTGEP